ncbi:hypothetical protein C5B42_04670 [Candidatus Cerribacteria bacterium 'Amazon FNV 2010 28 9']|uniref:FAS1 domain-containing protein n=1 Tax=Candidatus Cerribacteria bacterium 'Amazon FNV 2010 28 9' TaxID=2081795 RepID=A0A317JQJ4_9BACT|nr:MAG: hypothetical protein C5B42_04670 [Candidatus Cerribacteria bacterium 'Amazon FNV 2010 28 9']
MNKIFPIVATTLVTLSLAGCTNYAPSTSTPSPTIQPTSLGMGTATPTPFPTPEVTPKGGRKIGAIISSTAQLSRLSAMLTTLQLTSTLNGSANLTVFAPSNNAFAVMDQAQLSTLLQGQNRDKLTSLLTYHVVPGIYHLSTLPDGTQLHTEQGATVTIAKNNNKTFVNGIEVTQSDIEASNGVINILGGVLTPPQQ